ncbi:serine protease [Agrobacterium pusense]|uniref:serine protease n=1 Tax=Agrobacterium pusense TaxID=648995 RepID=UPI0021D284B8|nr:serine protease [Agrobacterium pusense]UXT93299.1 trypsin-like peptidase domain-containing protein [Agrobacterium pusense]
MPRIPRTHIDCVATIFVKNSRSRPVGTAFLLSYFDEGKYLITCQHCHVPNVDKIVFSTGESINFEPDAWRSDPEGNDVIARDVTDDLPDKIKSYDVPGVFDRVRDSPGYLQGSAVGDEIFMLGLHTPEATESAISPRARFGNISAWANENELNTQGNGNKRPSHIGDMRSRPGFSGSPVFTFPQSDDYNDSSRATLFGIHSAQFREDITVRTPDKEFPAWAPSSMTIIVPAWTLHFIDKDPVFKAARDKRPSLFR